MHYIEMLRIELKRTCKETNTNIKGIEKLVNYYINQCNWAESQAILYTLELFHNGTIEAIKSLGTEEKI